MVAASVREEARRWERNLVWTEERLDRLDRLVQAMGLKGASARFGRSSALPCICHDLRDGLSDHFLFVRKLLNPVRLGPSPDEKYVEIAVLSHQLGVLRRQVNASSVLPYRSRCARDARAAAASSALDGLPRDVDDVCRWIGNPGDLAPSMWFTGL